QVSAARWVRAAARGRHLLLPIPRATFVEQDHRYHPSRDGQDWPGIVFALVAAAQHLGTDWALVDRGRKRFSVEGSERCGAVSQEECARGSNRYRTKRTAQL